MFSWWHGLAGIDELKQQKEEKSDVCDYWPISLISCVWTSFENIVYKHIYNHITANSLFYKYQSGFLPGHSTVHHLIEFIHHTCLALEKYETICNVFCDISKAFDRVRHRGLIHKLKKYGNSGDLWDWIQNCLYMWNQNRVVNGTFPSLKFILAGLPQGSVLLDLYKWPSWLFTWYGQTVCRWYISKPCFQVIWHLLNIF